MFLTMTWSKKLFDFLTLFLIYQIILCTNGKKCRSIAKVKFCRHMPYNKAILPNNTNMKDVKKNIRRYKPLVKTSCSKDLRYFLCATLLPECQNGRVILPCKELCEKVNNGCNQAFRQNGFHFDCDQFPEKGSNAQCHNNENTMINTQRVNDTTKVAIVILKQKLQCESIAPVCRNMPYSKAMFPNILNHTNLDEAKREIRSFKPLIKSGCSNDLRFFLCSIYFPECQKGGPILPCQSLCQKVKTGCYPLMQKYGFSWPDYLKCNLFPENGTTAVCIDNDHSVGKKQTNNKDSAYSDDETEDNKNLKSGGGRYKTKCHSMKGISMCKNMAYNQTMLPNILNITNLATAKRRLNAFIPLIKVSCFKDMDFFLCSVFTPECKIAGPTPPCKELCERAKKGCGGIMQKFGFSWPHELNCSVFPSRGENAQCVDKETETENVSTVNYNKIEIKYQLTNAASRKGECHSINKDDICKNMPYNRTMFPNILNHRKIGEASRELQSYSPLIKVQCSKDLQFFLCSLYMPICNDFGPIPPCKSLCERSKAGCESLMIKFGFLWPDILNCERFPQKGSNVLCVETV